MFLLFFFLFQKAPLGGFFLSGTQLAPGHAIVFCCFALFLGGTRAVPAHSVDEEFQFRIDAAECAVDGVFSLFLLRKSSFAFCAPNGSWTEIFAGFYRVDLGFFIVKKGRSERRRFLDTESVSCSVFFCKFYRAVDFWVGRWIDVGSDYSWFIRFGRLAALLPFLFIEVLAIFGGDLVFVPSHSLKVLSNDYTIFFGLVCFVFVTLSLSPSLIRSLYFQKVWLISVSSKCRAVDATGFCFVVIIFFLVDWQPATNALRGLSLHLRRLHGPPRSELWFPKKKKKEKKTKWQAKKKRIRYLELDPQQHRIFLTLLAVFEKVGRLHRLLDDGRRGVAFFSLKRNPKPKNNKTKKTKKRKENRLKSERSASIVRVLLVSSTRRWRTPPCTFIAHSKSTIRYTHTRSINHIDYEHDQSSLMIIEIKWYYWHYPPEQRW